MPLRIGIANDLRLDVETLCRILQTDPEVEIAWTVKDGAEAVQKALIDKPDLILMDLFMPEMNGVQATAEIMSNNPCPILIVSSSIGENVGKVFEAMGVGALDAVRIPKADAEGKIIGSEEVLRKISVIKKYIGYERKPRNSGMRQAAKLHKTSDFPELVALGASTGGPKAVLQILHDLPKNLPASIIIVQHVDVKFARDLSDWLRDTTGRQVELAGEGSGPVVGKVFLAGTNDHLILGKDLKFHYTPDPVEYPYRPSVDEFFLSLEKNCPRKSVAVLLTGMGRDGAKGLLALRQAGWHTIAQDEKTSVVYGMPRAAIELEAATEVRSLESIAHAISERITTSEC